MSYTMCCFANDLDQDGCFELDKNQGIYEITCLPENASYIGSSTDIAQRLDFHYDDLKAGRHSNRNLQRLWGKYGLEGFFVGLVEFVDLLKGDSAYHEGNYAYYTALNIRLEERERFYIKQKGVLNIIRPGHPDWEKPLRPTKIKEPSIFDLF
ncbi:MAG: GIY-YIG nuclease family protein [Microcoleus sp.]